MTASVPEGFRRLDVTDDFVGLVGPLWFKAEEDGLRIGLPLEKRHGNPMGWAHGGLLVTVADMVMGVGSCFSTGMFWPHPTISLTSEFVRGARLGQWLEGKARVGLTAGASAPEVLVQGLIDKLATRYDITIEDVAPTRETVTFKLPRVLTS
jgi:acyl-coenzyme A thioesterase PaaI-like protein